MKADLDRLMSARDLQAIIVTGDAEHNPPRDYLTNGAHITGGLVVKKRGSAPVLIVNAMETEEAAKSGLQVLSYYDLNYAEILNKVEGDVSKATIIFWGAVLEQLEVPAGRIGLYGVGSLNNYLEMADRLKSAYTTYEFVGEMGMTLFDEAYVTKGPEEIARIKQVATGTSAVLRETWDFIAGHRAEGETVVKEDGSPLTIGDVKRFVRRALLDHELEDTNMIFAQGRDGAFPHSRGEAAMALQLGQPIVFDLFPRELGGGYFHDCTRTWSIGYATEETQAVYNTVMQAFQVAIDTYAEPGQPAHTLQDAVLDYFEGEGHSTPRSKPGTTEGYVHSLGHGVGLNIHERPSLHHLNKKDLFQQGNMITIEPGLYYPDKGIGVRIEDSFLIDESGALISITDFPKDLVLPLRG